MKENKHTTKSTAKLKTEINKTQIEIEPTITEEKPISQDFNKQTPQIKPYYVVIAIAIVAILSLLYYFRSFFIVAMVNGQPIWRSTLNDRMAKQYGQQMLDGLITEALIRQQADTKNLKISDDKIASETAKIEESLQSQGQTLDQVLILQGMTREDLEQQLKLNLLVEQLAVSEASTSADEVATYIKDNQEMLPQDLKGVELEKYVANLLTNQKKSQTIQSWLVNLKQGAKILTF